MSLSGTVMSELTSQNPAGVLGLDSQGMQSGNVQSQYSQYTTAFSQSPQQQQQQQQQGMFPMSTQPQVPSFQQAPQQQQQQQQQQVPISPELTQEFLQIINANPNLSQTYGGANLSASLSNSQLMMSIVNDYRNYMQQQQQQQQQQQNGGGNNNQNTQSNSQNTNQNNNNEVVESVEPLDAEPSLSDKLFELIKLPLIATVIFILLNTQYFQQMIIGFIPKLNSTAMFKSIGFGVIFFVVFAIVIEIIKYI